MQNPEKISLENICKITDCEHKTAPTQEEGIPLIRTPNIGRGTLLLDDVKQVSEEVFEIWSRRGKPQPGDLIMAREAPVGNVAIIPRDLQVCLGQRTVLLKPDSKQIDSRYLNYLLNSSAINSFLIALSNGATVGHLNVRDIRKLTLPNLPPLSVQKKIAAVLSAYDDLIENNDRRIALLEKMAEEIYREWFVRLRFPGHEQATFHKGIPEGWHVRELKDTDISIIDGDRGNNYPRKDEFSESGYCLFLNTGNIKNDRFVFSKNDFITKQKDSILRKGKLIENDIILTTRGTVGSVAFYSNNSAYQNVRINSGMVILRSKNAGENSLYYYYLMKSSLLKEQYKLYSSGAAQPQLPIKDLKRINVLIPPQELLSKFSGLVGTLNEQLDRYQLVNGNLKQTRDRLLTRLISGKLPVEDLDIQFPPSMIDDYQDSSR